MNLTFEVDQPDRLDRFLVRVAPAASRSQWVRQIQDGKVWVDGEVRRHGFPLKPGMVVTAEPPSDAGAAHLTPVEVPLSILYEDDDVLVVNKPRGLVTHPAPSVKGPTLVNALVHRGQGLSTGSAAYRPGIVHRLDKDTTGLLAVAKNESSHRHLAGQIASRIMDRRYLAVVNGDLEEGEHRIDAPLARDRKDRRKIAVNPEGRSATTLIRKVERLDFGTLIVAKLLTGRTHQIRVHLAGVGMPVVGDPLYNSRKNSGLALQLHAGMLAFDHPRTGARIRVVAPPPSNFAPGWAFDSLVFAES